MSEATTAERMRHTVAEEVRVTLARRRVSGVKLAEMIGRSQVYVSRRLRGEVPFDVEDLALVAEALGVKVTDLLPRDGYIAVSRHVQKPRETSIGPRGRRPAAGRPPGRMSGSVRPDSSRRAVVLAG